MIERFVQNPLITPADVKPSRPDFEVMCAFNAGATLYRGKTLLLVRVAERPKPRKGYVSTAFLDPEKPWIVRARLEEPVFVPEAPYEMTGLMPNVVFHNGLVDRGNGRLDLYYGAADTVTCGLSLDLNALLRQLRR